MRERDDDSAKSTTEDRWIVAGLLVVGALILVYFVYAGSYFWAS